MKDWPRKRVREHGSGSMCFRELQGAAMLALRQQGNEDGKLSRA